MNLAFASLLLAQLVVQPDDKNVVASRLEGTWVPMPALAKRLTGSVDSGPLGKLAPMAFRSDPSVFKKVPERYVKYLAAERVYLAGEMTLHGNDHPFFLVTNRGNPTIIYLRPKRQEPYGDAESFNVSLIIAKDPENDLLFIGAETIPRPFTAYERARPK